ncbi:MAG: HPr-rel-A system PqqD family peptide chaperone [Nitrosomonas sp.]|nr:HPr-rel-A system PqqD family peptide chaperone [Nitrosomonas sp.]
MRWLSNNFHSLLIADWEDEYTVFQPDSGKTHFLNRMSMQMLSFLDQHPASSAEVCSYLSREFERETNQNFQDSIEKILYHFDALGLIRKEN